MVENDFDPILEYQQVVAQPLDEWCEICFVHLATMTSADGVKACASCAAEKLFMMRGNRAMRRAAKKKKR